MGIFLIVKLFASLIGLTIPGYMLARALQLEARLAAAFPFSAQIICQTVMLLAILRLSIELLSRLPFYRAGGDRWRLLLTQGDWVHFPLQREPAR